MVRDKEKRKAYNKAYYQTPAGIKSRVIGHWKHRGLHVEDIDILYKWYLEATNCEKCGVEFVEGKRNRNSKVTDHDHYTKTNNFRAFLCLSCNCNDNSRNTSGTPNVYYHKKRNRWFYKKVINKKRHTKWFKTKQEAIDYKEEYESQIANSN